MKRYYEELYSNIRIILLVLQSHKLAIEKPRKPNEHPAGEHRNNNVESVPVSENSNSTAISDLGPGDTCGDTSGDTSSVGAKPIVLGCPESVFPLQTRCIFIQT